MFCENCSGELRREKKQYKCDKCGAVYGLDYGDRYEDFQAPGLEQVAPRGFSSKCNIIIIIIVAILVLGIGVVTALLIISNAPSARVNRYLTTAEKYLVEMNYDQAVIEFQRVLEIEPMNADAYLGLAEAYIGLGDTEKALEILRKGLKATGDSRLQAKIDELTKPIVSSSTSSVISSKPVESSSSKPIEDEHPVYGSMGFAIVAGTELDIATTESLLVYNKESYKSLYNSTDLQKLENGFSAAINLDKDLSDDDSRELSKLSNLKVLTINFASISDISFVSKLTNLTSLDLSDNHINDIMPICNLIKLTNLKLECNQISDILPIAGLTNLRYLAIGANEISNLLPLREIINLEGLSLHNNQISDITPLSKLKNLTYLYMPINKINDITPIAELKNLKSLGLGGNDISDITPLVGLKNLTFINLRGNRIAEADQAWLKEKLPNCSIEF